MIALLDANNGVIVLYGDNGKKIVPFKEIERIKDVINERVFYITNAKEVNGEDIINLVHNIGIKDSYPEQIETGESYIHSVTEETIVIDEELRFKGKFDIKLLDDEMREIIDNIPLIQQLIKMNKIEIIGDRERNILQKEIKIKKQKEIALQKEKDAQLDKVLLDRPATEMAAAIASGEVSIADSESETIDMEVEDDNYQTENERIISGLKGIKEE